MSKPPRLPNRVLSIGVSNHRVPIGRKGQHFEERLCCAAWVFIRREGGRVRSRTEGVAWSVSDIQAVIRQHSDRRSVLYVYCHGLGIALSVLGVWQYMRHGTYSLGRMAQANVPVGDTADQRQKQWRGSLITADPPSYLRCRSDAGVVEFCDLLNYFRMPLDEVAACFSITEQWPTAEPKESHEHLDRARRDARSVSAAVLALIDRWERGSYGPWRPTAAGLAWQAFRHSFGGHSLRPPRDDSIKEIERAAYYGGRSVARWIGKVRFRMPEPDEYYADPELNAEPYLTGPVYLLDVRQCYGWAMATVPLPIRYHRRVDDPTVGRLKAWLRRYGVIAVVRVRSDTESFPVRRFGITSEPVGEYWTCLAGAELERAVRTDSIAKVAIALLYTLGRPLARYARHWTTLRSLAEKSGDSASVALCKLMVNSLHGRFAITTPSWVLDQSLPVLSEWGPFHVLDTFTGRSITARSFGSIAQRRDKWGEHCESWPAVAAFLTSAVRERMLYLEGKAGNRQCLLVRTDSLAVTHRGYLALSDAGEIGDSPGRLRIVAGPTNDAVLYSESHYRLGSHVVRLGVRANAHQVCSGTWTQDAYRRIEASLTDGDAPAARGERVTVRLPAVIQPASVAGDGWQSRPVLRMTEPDRRPLPSEMLGIRWGESHRPASDQPSLFDGLPDSSATKPPPG